MRGGTNWFLVLLVLVVIGYLGWLLYTFAGPIVLRAEGYG